MFIGRSVGDAVLRVLLQEACECGRGNTGRILLDLGSSGTAFRDVCGACQAVVFLTICEFWAS